MNILGFNISVSRGSQPPAQRSLALDPQRWLRGDDVPAGQVLSNAYEQVTWVYRAINALAEQVANVPFLFSAGERGRENLITGGPLLDFYARPHPQLNRFQYWELRVIWLMLRGECFRIPIYDNGRAGARLKQILLPDPARFRHIIEDHQLIGWRYAGQGPQAPLAGQVFLPEEVWFERLPNPFDFWRGLPPLSVAATAAQTDFAAGAFMRGIIENNADTGIIVRTDKWLSDEQREQIVAALRDRKRKAGQADRPVLLLGSVEVIKPQLSSSDLQFLENRKFSRAEICAAFGVPEEIVTTTDHSKYDVMAGARLNFIENRIAPLCSRLEAEEDCTVKRIDPRASGWFDLDSLPILQEARRNRLTAARTGFDMGVPFNELNRVLDLGFRALPWGNRGYLPAKLQEVGSEGPAPKNENTSRTGFPEKPRGKISGPSNVRDQAQLPARLSTNTEASPGSPSDDPITRAANLLLDLERAPAASPQLVRKLSRFFFEQRCRALANLATMAANPGIPLLDMPAENAQLVAEIKPCLEAELALAAPEIPAEGLAQYAESRVPALAEINRLTFERLQAALAAGGEHHEPLEPSGARVKALFNEASAERAEAIAQVEARAMAVHVSGLEPVTNLATNLPSTNSRPAPRSSRLGG